MSETRRQPLGDPGLLEQVLEAVERPALVCDADGQIRACNDALVEQTAADDDVAGSPVDALLDWEGDPLTRALDSDEETTARGTVAVGETAQPCLATCRPLSSDVVAGGVVTLHTGDSWPLLAASVGGDGDYAYALDDAGTLRTLGESFERETGVPTDDVAGEHLAVLADRGVLDAEATRRLGDGLETLLRTDRPRLTFDARVSADGDERVLEHRLTPLTHDGETVGAVVVARDVTERDQTRGALRASHRRLSTIVENLPVIVLAVDEDERIEHYQGDGIEHFGYGRETVLGAELGAFESAYPDLVDSCRRALDGESVERTAEVGGRTFKCIFEPLDRTGDDGMIATAVDVTERVENERKLAATNRRLNLALRNTDAGVFEWQIGSDRAYWHDSISDLLGRDADADYRPLSEFVDLVHPEDRETLERAYEDALAGDGELAVECRIDHPEKGRRWLRIEGDVEYDDGEPARFVGVGRDVTDRRERERAIREERARFEKVLETSPVGITIVDADGEIVRANDRAEDVLGLPRAEITDRTFDDRDWNIVDENGDPIPSDDLPFNRVLETGDPVFEYEHGVEWPDGSRRWLSVNLAPIETNGDISYVVSALTDITERKERQRAIEESREKLRTVVESSPYPIFMEDSEGRYQLVNEAATRRLDLSPEACLDKTATEVFGPEDGAEMYERSQRVLETGESETIEESFELSDGERAFLTTRTPFCAPDGETRGVVTITRDVTERRRQQDQLETLTRIQQLVHESVGALAAATTESEIRTTVCERLAESPFYEFAWIGERDPSTREVRPDCWAGLSGDALQDVSVSVGPDDSEGGPVGRAYRSGEVTVVSDVGADSDVDSWLGTSLDREFSSVAAVPITHGSTTHGVLVVHSDRSASFSERELAGFETLGGTVGFALSAAQNRRLLESETVLELEFVARSERPAFRDASVEYDCRFVFDGVVEAGDGTTLCYLTVEDADPDDVTEVVATHERLERATRLDGEDGPHFELAVSDSTFQLLADAGARGTRIVVENGHSRIVAEAPVDVDVRRVRDALEPNYRQIDFVTRREVEPTDSGWTPAGKTVDSRLTRRQRSVLRVAFYSGYYDWPRETDAETLADSLGVATSTTLQHLRKGHRNVLSALFDS